LAALCRLLFRTLIINQSDNLLELEIAMYKSLSKHLQRFKERTSENLHEGHKLAPSKKKNGPPSVKKIVVDKFAAEKSFKTAKVYKLVPKSSSKAKRSK
jgi:hypothetical protein